MSKKIQKSKKNTLKKVSLFQNPESSINIVSVLGREEGYTVKYVPLPEGVP